MCRAIMRQFLELPKLIDGKGISLGMMFRAERDQALLPVMMLDMPLRVKMVIFQKR
jgi:hypothetical protein